MQQFRLILAVLLFAGSDAFFLSLFKPQFKPDLSYSYNYRPPQPGYAAYPPPAPAYYSPPAPTTYSRPPAPTYSQSYEPYKIPVWQAMPSGYVAQPYSYSQQQTYNQRPQPTYGYSSPPHSTTNYGSVSYTSPTGYHTQSSPYDSVGNSVTGGSPDYTGESPLISVPVYFPKDGSSSSVPVPTSYSNGVSGFYDSSVAGSSGSSVTVVGQAVPVPVPIASVTTL